MAKYNNDHDHGSASQWASPGQSWTTQSSNPPGTGQARQWQGQATQYQDPSQAYYDPNNPQPWHQGPQFAGHQGPQAKPPHKRWWFWTIVVVVLVGLVAIIIALLPTGESGADASNDAPQTTPVDPDTSREAPETTPQDPDASVLESGIQRSGDGSFILDDGGTPDDALAEAQERINSGYLHYGPGDLIYTLRSDGYQNDAIEYTLNNLDVDWDAQALGVAQRIADSEHGGYSAKAIQEQLAYSNFSDDETQYALDNLDIDYNEQALQALESYLDLFDDKSESEARDYIGYAGFEESEIDYAFDNID